MSKEKIITKLECYYKIKEITEEPDYVRPKKQKLSSFGNVTEVLNKCGVYIAEKPAEKELHKQWQNEKNKIQQAFDRVLEDKKKYEKNPNTYTFEGNFFDSKNYKLLTYVVEPTINSMVL
jgi:hypothetical protein